MQAAPQAGAIVSTALLHGLGGVGKTRLALEYAWRHRAEHTATLFVAADSEANLNRNLAALCGPAVLNLPEHQLTEERVQVAAALRWLQSHPGWLLILDNVDSEAAAAAVEKLLPALSVGQVLITSRFDAWSAAVQPLPLGVLSEAAAVEFLLARTAHRRRAQADDAATARTLVGELGGLALALEQAGAYIVARRLSLGDYLLHWQQRRSQALAWFDARTMQYPASVAITWQTSFDQLSASARRLLQRLAWLAPEPVPESLLAVPVPGLEAKDDAGAALAELERYSLVTRDGEAPNFSVHRLVQAVARQAAADSGALAEALNWVDDGFVGNPQDVRDWPALEPLLPHARSVAAYGDDAGIAQPTSRLMNQCAVLLQGRALHAEAEPLMRRALAIDTHNFGAQHPRVAVHLSNLARLLHATNRLGEAEPLMRRALAIDEQSAGAEHPKVAIRLNNLAQLLKTTNRLDEAEPLTRRALAINERCYGAEHPDVARNLNNLAQLLQDTNRLSEAEPLMRRALAIDERSCGAKHPNVARDLSNLALLLKATNRLSEAEALMRRALAIDEQSFSAEHPTVARDLNNLARLLHDTNRPSEAEPLMRRAVVIRLKSLGPSDPWTQGSIDSYRVILAEMGHSAATVSAQVSALQGGIESPPPWRAT